MTLKTFNNNPMGQNIYLYHNERQGVLIDAGCSAADQAAIASAIKDIKIKAILLTHGHYDHITAAEEMKDLTGSELYCHESEKPMLESPGLNLSFRTGKEIKISPDQLLKDGDIIRFGNTELKVLHTPGHTAGGVCYYDEENGNLFSGDTLFLGDVGRTDLPGGDHSTLVSGIKAKLLVLPDSTAVYPGHDSSTTIGAERRLF